MIVIYIVEAPKQPAIVSIAIPIEKRMIILAFAATMKSENEGKMSEEVK